MLFHTHEEVKSKIFFEVKRNLPKPVKENGEQSHKNNKA